MDSKLNKEVFQSNIITNAKYEMSALEKNMLYMVMAQMKKTDDLSTKYIISANEIMAQMDKEIHYAKFKEASIKLNSRVISGVDENGNFFHTAFISSAKYISGKGIIEIRLSELILPYYIDLKNKFTSIQIDHALSLTSIYSKRLYELLSSYKNFPDKSFIMTIKELKEQFYVINEKGVDKYPSFAMFNDNVLSVAIDEINGKTDIYCSYEQILGKKWGKGRKPVESIKFSLIYRSENNNGKVDVHNEPIYNRVSPAKAGQIGNRPL